MAIGPARCRFLQKRLFSGSFQRQLRLISRRPGRLAVSSPSKEDDRMLTMRARILVLIPSALVAAACAVDEPTTAVRSINPDQASASDAVKFWEAGATV